MINVPAHVYFVKDCGRLSCSPREVIRAFITDYYVGFVTQSFDFLGTGRKLVTLTLTAVGYSPAIFDLRY